MHLSYKSYNFGEEPAKTGRLNEFFAGRNFFIGPTSNQV
jgi:hypothetical protein